MNPEIKEKWIAALRSGDYKQGKSYLAKKGVDGVIRYCCLGVLCEIAVKEGIAQRFHENSSFIAYGISERYQDETYLTKEIAAWAGIRYNGQLHEGDVEKSTPTNNLAVANDAELSFEHIAKMIEENL